MNRLRFCGNGRAHNTLHIQITFCTLRWPNTHCLICKLRMQSFLICFRINSNRQNSHFPAGTYNAHGNLSPVGNQYFLKHFKCSFNFLVLQYTSSSQPIAKVSSAITAVFPFTVAVAFPTPTGPFCLMISSSSSSTSPGTTFCLNLALLIAPK